WSTERVPAAAGRAAAADLRPDGGRAGSFRRACGTGLAAARSAGALYPPTDTNLGRRGRLIGSGGPPPRPWHDPPGGDRMRTVCAATGAPNARMRARARFASAFVLAVSLAAPSPSRVAAQQLKPRFSIDDVVSYNFPYDLVAARKADRIAWIEFERGMRNVYTAAAPDFEPVRLTSFTEDDGVDLSDLQISDDGSIVAFIRGHTRNREGWVANPSSDPRGAERAVWAVSTSGGKPWRVVQADAFQLSPDGKWVAYVRDGQIHRAPVNPGLAASQDLDATPPLFRAYGINGSPTWSPDGRRIAFVSDRGDHSFIGVYDLDNPRIVYLAPSVVRDANPVWSPDGKRIAFQRRPGLSFGEMAARQRQGGGFGGPQRRAADDALPGMFEARFR